MTEQHAREIFGLPSYANRKQGYNRYRYLLKKYHPDKGGSTERCQQIITAWKYLEGVLSEDLRIVTLQEFVNNKGEKRFMRLANRTQVGKIPQTTFFTYERVKSNVYICRLHANEERFYPRFPEEDKVLHDGKNCKVILFPKGELGCDWAEWTVIFM